MVEVSPVSSVVVDGLTRLVPAARDGDRTPLLHTVHHLVGTDGADAFTQNTFVHAWETG